VAAAIDQFILEQKDTNALEEWQGAATHGQEFQLAVWGQLGSRQRSKLKELANAAKEPIENPT
jgi:hypothetical protein